MLSFSESSAFGSVKTKIIGSNFAFGVTGVGSGDPGKRVWIFQGARLSTWFHVIPRTFKDFEKGE